MRKQAKVYSNPVSLLMIVLIVSVLSINVALAKGYTQQAAHVARLVSSGEPAIARMLAHHTVDMHKVPMATRKNSSRASTAMPARTGIDPQVYERWVKAAAHSKSAPRSFSSYVSPKTRKNFLQTPVASNSFQGEGNTCGCAPPDMAVAASPSFVLQGVNTSYAVYDTSGSLQPGFPKTAQDFFGIPADCTGNTAFVSDPRTFYDPNDQRFWAAILQFPSNSCTNESNYWLAVSQSNDPTGGWNIYSFDMSLGTTNSADYTQLAFDRQAVYFSANMFDSTGVNYQYAELFGANKSQMESGASVTAYGFHNLTVGGVAVDTVQPVYTLDSNPPPSELFVNSFNINFGGGICNNGCSGLVVWALTKPGTPDTQLNGVVVSTSNYQLAPRADEPGCSQCIPTSDPPDTRITGTPVLNSGLISFALTTAINNGSQTVPGAFWGQINPVLNPDGSISSGSILQSGYFNYSGDGAATYPAMMPDTAGNLFMVFEFMNNNSNPSVAYVARRVTDPAGTFPDGGIFLKQGDAPTTDPRWGDYEAASYDGSNVWFAGEYSGSDGTWSTYIGEDHF